MKSFRIGIVKLAIVLGFLASSLTTLQAANPETKPLLNNLFAELKIAKSQRAALEIEGRIWAAWYQSGDPKIDQMMRRARTALAERSMRDALTYADEIVAKAPNYSEGWNFRATALFVANRLDESLTDVVRVLALEPRHFGALSGTALIMLRKGKRAAALKAVNAAIEIHPHLRGAAEIIRQAGSAKKEEPI